MMRNVLHFSHKTSCVIWFFTYVLCLQQFCLGPFWTGENSYMNFFVLAYSRYSKIGNLCFCIVNNYNTHTIVTFGNPLYFQIVNYCYWICNTVESNHIKVLFCLVHLKSVVSLQSLSLVMITPTLWQCSQWLCWHQVHIQ